MLLNTSAGRLLNDLSMSMIGTDSSIKEMTLPKGLLEHIINFITFGKIRKDKEDLYNQIMTKMESTFSGLTAKEMEDGRKIHVDCIHGCEVSFYYTGHTNNVTVEVIKSNKLENKEINAKNFFNIF